MAMKLFSTFLLFGLFTFSAHFSNAGFYDLNTMPETMGAGLDCANMCVTNIAINDSTGMMEVTILNGSIMVNYPVVVVVVGEDTIANQNAEFFLFAQLAAQLTTHELPTALKSLPANFQCTVHITDNIYNTSCALSYPCLPDHVESIDSNVNVQLFPVPAENNLVVKGDKSMNAYRIFDHMGRIVQRDRVNASYFSLDLDLLSSGMYVIEIESDDKRIQRSFFKQ